MRRATSVGRDRLISLGVCFGKFTKTRKFKLHITALDYLAQYAKVRYCNGIWGLRQVDSDVNESLRIDR